MLVRGYINFFEGECCFIGDGRSPRFLQLCEGAHVYLSCGGPPAVLTVSNGKWALDAPEAPDSLQGLSIWVDVSTL